MCINKTLILKCTCPLPNDIIYEIPIVLLKSFENIFIGYITDDKNNVLNLFENF